MLVPAGARYPGQSELFARVRNGPRRLFAHVAASGNTRRGELIRFINDTVWPGANTTLVNLVGAGAPGLPETAGDQRWRIVEFVTKYYTQITGDGGNYEAPREFSAVPSTGYTYRPATPANRVTYDYYEWGNVRNTYDYEVQEYTTGNAATTGPSATAFSKTFLGGTGGAAAETRFDNVLILPNTPYQIIVPTGGFIELTYNP